MKRLITAILLTMALVVAGIDIAPAVAGLAAGSDHVANVVAVAALAAVMPQPLAMSVIEFCRLHSISRAFFYKLRAAGLAPATMQVGNRTLISIEAAARWRAEREAATAAESRKFRLDETEEGGPPSGDRRFNNADRQQKFRTNPNWAERKSPNAARP